MLVRPGYRSSAILRLSTVEGVDEQRVSLGRSPTYWLTTHATPAVSDQVARIPLGMLEVSSDLMHLDLQRLICTRTKGPAAIAGQIASND